MTPSPHTSLVLAGGNALGAYTAGAYEALQAAGYAFDLISGTSIGAVQAAIIAGNPPERRIERLRAFWDLGSQGSAWWPAPAGGRSRDAFNKLHAMQTMLTGRPGLFTPRISGRWSLLPGTPPDIGLFDSAPMYTTLERLVDFDLLNDGALPIVLNGVDLASGETVCFDSRRQRIEPRHVVASTAFIPGFPPVEIDGRWIGDGGLTCNLPLDPVLGVPLARDQRCFAIDLFDLVGEPPRSMNLAVERVQDITFASQSIRTLEAYEREHVLRHRLATLARASAAGSAAVSAPGPAFASASTLAPAPAPGVVDGSEDAGAPVDVEVVLIAYRPPLHDAGAKTLEFSSASIDDRWAAGHADMSAAIGLLRTGRPSRHAPGFALYDGRRRETSPPADAASAR